MVTEARRAYNKAYREANREQLNAQARAKYVPKPPRPPRPSVQTYVALPDTITCNACKTSVSKDDFYFYKSGPKQGRLVEKVCVSCKRAKITQYNKTHKRELAEYARTRCRPTVLTEAQAEELRAYQRSYYAANREKLLAAQKRYRAANPEKERARKTQSKSQPKSQPYKRQPDPNIVPLEELLLGEFSE